jgi:hypothetical protein
LEVVGERTFKIKNMDYYPKTDKEIRMYCLEYIRDPFNMAKSEDIINSAQRIYDFICPKPKSVTARLREWRKKSLERICLYLPLSFRKEGI